MNSNEVRDIINKISPMYPDLKDILSFIVNSVDKEGLSTEPVDELFRKELISINGIAEKEANNIVSVFPTKNSLVKWITSCKELPFNSNIDKILIERYKLQ